MQQPYPPNVQEELAHERNHLAADRSLLSFIRSSVTLMGTGIGVVQVVEALSFSAPFINQWAYSLSLLLIGLGVINLLFAALDCQGEMNRLKQPQYYFTPRPSLGGVTGLALFIVGLAAFLRLAVNMLN